MKNQFFWGIVLLSLMPSISSVAMELDRQDLCVQKAKLVARRQYGQCMADVKNEEIKALRQWYLNALNQMRQEFEAKLNQLKKERDALRRGDLSVLKKSPVDGANQAALNSTTSQTNSNSTTSITTSTANSVKDSTDSVSKDKISMTSASSASPTTQPEKMEIVQQPMVVDSAPTKEADQVEVQLIPSTEVESNSSENLP